MTEIQNVKTIAIEMSAQASLALYQDLLGTLSTPATESIGSVLKSIWDWIVEKIHQLINWWNRFIITHFRKDQVGLIRNFKIMPILVRALSECTTILSSTDLPKLRSATVLTGIDFEEIGNGLAQCSAIMDECSSQMAIGLLSYNEDKYYKKIPIAQQEALFSNSLTTLNTLFEKYSRTLPEGTTDETLRAAQRVISLLADCQATAMTCIEQTQMSMRDKYLSVDVTNVQASMF